MARLAYGGMGERAKKILQAEIFLTFEGGTFNEYDSEYIIYFFQIEMLKSWDGDMKKLGNAERFLLQLIDVKK